MLSDKSALEISNAAPELDSNTLPIRETQGATMPGIVEKIIASPNPGLPEKAQIAIEGADHLYRELRIENKLSDENGDDVKLKRGAHVEVSVTTVDEAIPHDAKLQK